MICVKRAKEPNSCMCQETRDICTLSNISKNQISITQNKMKQTNITTLNANNVHRGVQTKQLNLQQCIHIDRLS